MQARRFTSCLNGAGDEKVVDRQAFDDFALAVLVAFPLAVLAYAHPVPAHRSAIAMTDAPPALSSGRIGLLG